MLILNIFIFLVIAGLGYFLGKLAKKKFTLNFKNFENLAHYWIIGFILAIIGLSFLNGIWQLLSIAFGLGIFMSDIKKFSEIEVPANMASKVPEITIKPGQELKKMFLIGDEGKKKKKTTKSTSKKTKTKKNDNR